MFTSPSTDDLLEGIMVALGEEVLPYVTNPRAQATVAMMQAVILQVRATLPRYTEYVIDEHNAMTDVLRRVAATIGDAAGPEADRIRARAATLGQKANVPAPPDMTVVGAAHKELGEALVDTLVDLDVLQRAGDARGDEALGIVRGHWGPRYARDVATLLVGAGMIGRG